MQQDESKKKNPTLGAEMAWRARGDAFLLGQSLYQERTICDTDFLNLFETCLGSKMRQTCQSDSQCCFAVSGRLVARKKILYVFFATLVGNSRDLNLRGELFFHFLRLENFILYTC